TPWPSPTTTRALKLRFLPPLTTLVTRLIETTLSWMSSSAGSIRSRVRIRLLEFQSCFARGVRYGANATVIEEAAAVEDHALDALFDGQLGDDLADRLGTLQVAAGHTLLEGAFHRRFHAG